MKYPNLAFARKRSFLLAATLILVLLLVAVFIWPTPYEKEKIRLGMFGTQTIRTNRFTRTIEIYGTDEWQPIIRNPDSTFTIPQGTQIMVR